MNKPVNVSLQNKTVRQALNSILRNGHGYSWRLRGGIIEITNGRASRNLQRKLDKQLKGFVGRGLGGARSPTLKAATLHNRTVREILAYVVLNGGVEGWIVAGPPECLGFTPYCGLWFLIEGELSDPSYEILLQNIRNNI